MSEGSRVVLEQMHIRDIGVIDDVTVDLAPGLTVLTGETGAGKTMVVAALELLLGARAESHQVRAGADRALVEGQFAPAPISAADWVADGDEVLVVSREIGGARNRVRVAGQLASVSALAELLADVVEVHAQADAQRLNATAVQRELLDRSGGAGLAARRAAYDEAYLAWQEAAAELQRLRDSEGERAIRLERLRFEFDDIAAVAPEAGEENAVEAELARLEHAETLATAGRQAAAALTEEGGGRDALGAAVAALRAVGGIDADLDGQGQRLEALAVELQDVALDLAAYGEAVDLDPARLDALRERRAVLAGLCRRYGPDTSAVLAHAERVAAELDALERGEARSGALAEHVEQLAAACEEAGQALRAARTDAGAQLAAAVDAHLAELAMADARMQVALDPIEPSAHGMDRVTFQLAAHAGSPPLPLAKAASGGERSRVALALRLALADADDTPVLVFDEVDAGIGGATALAVGEKLAALARGRQVLCVTHLAQLAAHADRHLVVSKATEGGHTVATVRAVADHERVRELSRMLGGDPVSAEAERHAAALLAAARGLSDEGRHNPPRQAT